MDLDTISLGTGLPATPEAAAKLADKADEYRTKLLEAVAETDEALLEKYFGGEELSIEEIKGALERLAAGDLDALAALLVEEDERRGVDVVLLALAAAAQLDAALPNTSGYSESVLASGWEQNSFVTPLDSRAGKFR